MKTRELKFGYLVYGSSMYHLAATPLRVCWNSLNLMESSTMLLDEHHRWNVIIWFWGHSPALPSNLGMSDDSLVGMGCSKDFSLLQGKNGSLPSIGRKGRFVCGNTEKKSGNETR